MSFLHRASIRKPTQAHQCIYVYIIYILFDIFNFKLAIISIFANLILGSKIPKYFFKSKNSTVI